MEPTWTIQLSEEQRKSLVRLLSKAALDFSDSDQATEAMRLYNHVQDQTVYAKNTAG